MTDHDTRVRIEEAAQDAKGIAWDGCHKIYLAMDDGQVQQFVEYGYDVIVAQPDRMAYLLQEWWEQSCGLRFISAVRTTPNPNDGFTDVIPQFADDDTDEEVNE